MSTQLPEVTSPVRAADRSARLAVARYKREKVQHQRTAAKLQEALERAEALRQLKDDLVQQKEMLAKEFDHRLLNSLQLIGSLLSLQSRATEHPEAAAQLAIAANRVAALGRVHRRLHVMDHVETIEFKEYLARLCQDLSEMLFHDAPGHAIVVEGLEVVIPTLLGIPLGFIVNEMVTNAAKYTKGIITVRLESTEGVGPSLSVTDDGDGLPENFRVAGNKGLGMKIILSLVKQIGGELQIGAGDDGRGTCFRVLFGSSVAAISDGALTPALKVNEA